MKMTFLKRFAILSLLVSLSVMLSGCGSTSVLTVQKLPMKAVSRWTMLC